MQIYQPISASDSDHNETIKLYFSQTLFETTSRTVNLFYYLDVYQIKEFQSNKQTHKIMPVITSICWITLCDNRYKNGKGRDRAGVL